MPRAVPAVDRERLDFGDDLDPDALEALDPGHARLVQQVAAELAGRA
jgi:hypothetical protein